MENARLKIRYHMPYTSDTLTDVAKPMTFVWGFELHNLPDVKQLYMDYLRYTRRNK
jgi:hypothetical protein